MTHALVHFAETTQLMQRPKGPQKLQDTMTWKSRKPSMVELAEFIVSIVSIVSMVELADFIVSLYHSILWDSLSHVILATSLEVSSSSPMSSTLSTTFDNSFFSNLFIFIPLLFCFTIVTISYSVNT